MFKTKGVKVYPPKTEMSVIKSIDSGDDLPDVVVDEVNESYIEVELYNSINTLNLNYPIDGVNYNLLREGAFIKYPVNYGDSGVDVYKISAVRHNPEIDLIEVDAEHWTIDFMYNLIPTLTYREGLTVRDLLNSIFAGVDGLDDLNINYKINNGETVVYEALFNSLFSSDQTLGGFLIGPASPAYRLLNIVVIRDFEGLTLINRGVDERKKNPDFIEESPIIEGVNIIDWSYETEVGRSYNVIAPSSSSIPTLTTWGDEGIFGVLDGIGGTKYKSLQEIPVGYEVYFLYKGLPFLIKNIGGSLFSDSVYFFEGNPSQQRMIELMELKATNRWYVVSLEDGLLNVVNSSTGETIFNESMDLNYLKAYAVQISGDRPISVSKSEMGVETSVIDLRPFTNPESAGDFTLNYLSIPKTKGFLQVETIIDNTDKSRAVHFEDFIQSEGDEFAYFKWCKDVLPNLMIFVDDRVNKEPRYKIQAKRDNFDGIYGDPDLSGNITNRYSLGKLYRFIVESYNVNKEVSLNRYRFNGIYGRFLELEFSDLLDSEVEVSSPKVNKPSVFKGSSNYTIPKNTNNNNTGGLNNKEIEELKGKLKEFEEFNNGLDELYNSLPYEESPINEGINDLPKITPEYRNDDGPKRVEWSEPILVYSPKLSRTIQQTRPIFFNFTDAERKVAKLIPKIGAFHNYGRGLQDSASALIPKNRVYGVSYVIGKFGDYNDAYRKGQSLHNHFQKAKDGLGYKEEFGTTNFTQFFDLDRGVLKWYLNLNLNAFILGLGYGLAGDGDNRPYLHELVDSPLLNKSFVDTPYYKFLQSLKGLTLQEIKDLVGSLGDDFDGRVKKALINNLPLIKESGLNRPLVGSTRSEVKYYLNKNVRVFSVVQHSYFKYTSHTVNSWGEDIYRYSLGDVKVSNIDLKVDGYSYFTGTQKPDEVRCLIIEWKWDPSTVQDSFKNARIYDLMVLIDPPSNYETESGDLFNINKAKDELTRRLELHYNNLTPAQQGEFIYTPPSNNPVVNKISEVFRGKRGTEFSDRYNYNVALISFLTGRGKSGVTQAVAQELYALNNAAYVQNIQ